MTTCCRGYSFCATIGRTLTTVVHVFYASKDHALRSLSLEYCMLTLKMKTLGPGWVTAGGHRKV